MVRRGPLGHDEECDLLMYEEGGHCTCPDETPRRVVRDRPVYGEDADPYDGRLAGPSLDW